MKLELLSPAKNLEYGMAAIDSGADAVYIGGVGFSARAAAHNDIESIKSLVEYAHRFGAKVYVAMNTILYESELEEARQVAEQLVEVGVDALIIQDLAYAKMGLDIALHASTQLSCDSVERAKFLAGCGFSRIVLERGLSIEEIRDIAESVDVELEAFVHGAICVSTSGKCYMSHIVSSRSGNRGCCSQPCRSRFDLEDGSGEVLMRGKHLLSLKDMNLSENIGELVGAGVMSLKIEGRLKDLAYLKNSTAYYNRKLDEFIKGDSRYSRLSDGYSLPAFEASLESTFSRGFTTYNLPGRSSGVASLDSANAIGSYVGVVSKVGRDSFMVDDMQRELHAGDGVVLYSASGAMAATNINGAEGRVVYPNKMAGIVRGMKLYRNYDKEAIDTIISSNSRRRIDATVEIQFSDSRVVLSAKDSYGYSGEISKEVSLDAPKDMARAVATIKEQLAKSGDTIFNVTDVEIVGEPLFMPIKLINELRRELLEQLLRSRLSSYQRPVADKMHPSHFEGKVGYSYNVTNSLSKEFYLESGAVEIASGVELMDNPEGVAAMTTHYCIRREIGECLREGGRKGELYIRNGRHRFRLEFDCKRCIMNVVYYGK